ncbi:uncharacterized protein FSUBG_10598 [Fusarium subglutinans]|uniref:Secreted protein n=1 Tax=Gibberella subglutinans TaxID=42677 RepID=A0A8H5LGK2_GIBSU|nr:uncharacterized protein FSUBG_10598 [Fusarium subglutinans]KAF5590996.1 hypothetical protein FSUBG_10598 [Fusarium subglutinans]
MHVSKLFIVGAIVTAAEAFTCARELFGQCYFVDGNPVGQQQRCAIKCENKFGHVNCVCPDYYPKNNKGWPYSGKHECIPVGMAFNAKVGPHANSTGPNLVIVPYWEEYGSE